MEIYIQVVEECVSASRMHITALEEVKRRLSSEAYLLGIHVGEQAYIYNTVCDVLNGLEITVSKLETIQEVL